MSPKSLAHVVLRTGQLKPMVAFYKAFLGAHAAYENDQMAFLTYDDEHHRIALVATPGTASKVRESAGLEHIAFTFSSLGDLLTAYQQRKALGILPIWCVNHGPTTSMYYQDPDGHQLETQVDNFETTDEANAFMMSKDFASNPLGVDFDPEDMVRRLNRGEPESELMKRPDIGPRDLESNPLINPPKSDVREVYAPVSLDAAL